MREVGRVTALPKLVSASIGIRVAARWRLLHAHRGGCNGGDDLQTNGHRVGKILKGFIIPRQGCCAF